MLRFIGLAFLTLAAVALFADWRGSEGGLAFASLGQRWFEVHQTSLIGLQSGLENRVSQTAFFDYVQPVLELPAAGVAAGLGLAFLILGQLRRRR